MTKLCFISLLCALISADAVYAASQHLSYVVDATGRNHPMVLKDGTVVTTLHGLMDVSRSGSVSSGYTAEQVRTSSPTQTDSTRHGDEKDKSGAGVVSAVEQKQGVDDKDHNGLTEDEVHKLAAEGNRRRIVRPNHYMYPPRPILKPSVGPYYKPIYPTKYPAFSRSADEVESEASKNAEQEVEVSQRSDSLPVQSVDGDVAQDVQNSRRGFNPFFPGNDCNYNPYSPCNPCNNCPPLYYGQGQGLYGQGLYGQGLYGQGLYGKSAK